MTTTTKKVWQSLAAAGTAAVLISGGCVSEKEQKNPSENDATQTATTGPTMGEMLAKTKLGASENGTQTCPEFFIGIRHPSGAANGNSPFKESAPGITITPLPDNRIAEMPVFRNLNVSHIPDGSVSRSDMQKPGKLKA